VAEFLAVEEFIVAEFSKLPKNFIAAEFLAEKS